jgi:hypothetical protein
MQFGTSITKVDFVRTARNICSRNVTYWITNSFPRRVLLQRSQTLRLENELIWRLFLQVYLHSASEIPDVSSHFMDLEHRTQLTASVVSLAIYSTSDVRSLSLSQRKCRFPEESDLDISPVYSYNLCRMQCRMDQAMRLCGCVPHFYRTSSKSNVGPYHSTNRKKCRHLKTLMSWNKNFEKNSRTTDKLERSSAMSFWAFLTNT